MKPVNAHTGPTTRSKSSATGQATVRKPRSPEVRKRSRGFPVGHDGQGRPLYRRASDGKLVYLRCCVAGCERTNFNTIDALRLHVCKSKYKHKLKGTLTTNRQAVEICGIVAPGQEECDIGIDENYFEAAPFANMTVAKTTAPLNDPSDAFNVPYHEESNESTAPESGSTSATLIESDSSRSSPRVRANAHDLTSVHRNDSVNPNGEAIIRSLRPEQTANHSERLPSSDSEDDSGSQPVKSSQVDRIRGNRVRRVRAAVSTSNLSGAELYDICLKQAQKNANNIIKLRVITLPDIKSERGTTPAVDPRVSTTDPIHTKLADAPPSMPAPSIESMPKRCQGVQTPIFSANLKRLGSEPLNTDFPPLKRCRGVSEPLTA